MKRYGKWLPVVLFFSLLVVTCGGDNVAQAAERKLKDTLRVTLLAEPGTLDPCMTGITVNQQTTNQIFNQLVRVQSNGDITPELAHKWERLDDLTIRFYLREGVLFHNGDKMTAEDVAFSLGRLNWKGANTAMYSILDGANTKVVDDYTIDVKLTRPFAGVFHYLGNVNAGIVSKKYVEKEGEDINSRQPVGTGPFRFVEWKSGESILLERNENYWDAKPTFSKLILTFIIEPTNRTIELETGGTDIIFTVAPSDVDRIRNNKNLKLLLAPGRRFTYITLNMSDPVFKDRRIREALHYAIDMEALAEAVYGDMAVVADGIISPVYEAAWKPMKMIPYDPAKARELLKEAVGGKLDITFKMNENRQFIDVSEIVQNMWNAVGINVNLQVLEMATFTAAGAAGEVQVGISSYAAASGYPGHQLQPWMTIFRGQLQANDKKIDELLLAASAEYDPVKRKELFGVALDYMYNTLFYIPVVFNNVSYATRKNVENFEAHPGEMPELRKVIIYEE